MRIVAGKYRRRVLRSLKGKTTRPMLDRMRETLFNILQLEVPGCVFADLYAGTGAVGIEALSRGARQAIFVESSRAATKLIEENLKLLGAEQQGRILLGEVAETVARIDADIWFLGPPYPATEQYALCLKALDGKAVRLAVAQHAARFSPPEQVGNLARERVVRVGSNALSFFRPAPL